MKTVIEACTPRRDILGGTFNPEIFTASLSQVMRHYESHESAVHSIYTDAEEFFREATYPTDGLRMVVSEVFGRLAGDASVPAIHRLETAFGGGKTHTLIACAHIAFRGKELQDAASHILAPDLLPEPGEVRVVGIAGDEIPVHKPVGSQLKPYTLWGEIAYQVGGEELYRSVHTQAESYAAPGMDYFDVVFGDRKILVMLDELAQYAARFSAVRQGGGDQVAAFLMALHGYARTRSTVSILLTLAGSTDAFATQTQELARRLSEVTGRELSPDDALEIGQQAVRGVISVVARDATSVVPVQAAEISRVLAKRLFTSIDDDAARAVAEAYMEMYRKNRSLLPEQASRADFKDRLVGHYPFHPTLIDFLNHKLAASEDFQGTRGVLRVLALTVRNIWRKNLRVPMIHTCHMDLRDARTVNEMVARTGGGALLPVLNADVGGADTDTLEGGRSNAELADLENPHPEGWPLHEYTWKTVFLHSLVGRDQGFQSHLFGITEREALFQVSFPGLTPPQVAEALKKIGESAYYLRFDRGRYFASLEPSINRALAGIRRSLSSEEVEEALDAVGRKVVSGDVKTFHVVHDVAAPEHIPDNKGKPVLALVNLGAGELDVEACVTTAGPNRPRMEQNLVLLLVPDTVIVSAPGPSQRSFSAKSRDAVHGVRNRLFDLARTVLAMRRLVENPQNYGISPEKLRQDEFERRSSERGKALETAVTETYRNLWYPSADGTVVRKEIRTAGGEGGASVLEQIRKVLLDEGELVTADHCTGSGLAELKKLFFSQADVASLAELRKNFRCRRSWPILEDPAVLDQVIRSGVERGFWCLFRMDDDEATRPEEFYHQETGELPFHLDLSGAYSIVTPEGARKRGWTRPETVEPAKVRDWVSQAVKEKEPVRVGEIVEAVKERWGDVPDRAIQEELTHLVQRGRLVAARPKPDQETSPDVVLDDRLSYYDPNPDDMVTTPRKAAEEGWIAHRRRVFELSGRKGAEILLPLLRRIGSFYRKGATTPVRSLDLTELELPRGGTLRIAAEDLSPESLEDLGELFEVVVDLVRLGEETEAYLEIEEPHEDCPFMAELKKASKE